MASVLAAMAACSGTGDDPAQAAAAYAYPDDGAPACAFESRPATLRTGEDWRGPRGLRAVVRPPSNYRPSHAHALLMVYAAAGMSPAASERFTGLTPAATARGYIVAYAASRRLTLKAIRALGTLPAELARTWCIDPARVVVVGHSDGGTIAAALGFLPDSPLRPASIVASAPGLQARDLEAYGCPAAVPVLVMGQRKDRLFPGYARELADWYAACNGCTPRRDPATGCIDYHSCPGAAPTRYCESTGGHREWPGHGDALFEFLARAPALRAR